MQTSELDTIDKRILTELQRDSKITNVELASRIGLSPSPCLVRVRELKKRKIIRNHVALVDPRKIGINVNLFAHISLERQSRQTLDIFEKAISALPQVMECYLMTGESDYLIRVVARDIPELERLLADELTKINGVMSIRSSFALKQVKYDTALPMFSDVQ